MERNDARKSLIYAYGVMYELAERGLVEGGSHGASPRGVSEFDQIVASGWKPSREVLRQTLEFIGVPADMLVPIVRMIEAYESGTLDDLIASMDLDK